MRLETYSTQYKTQFYNLLQDYFIERHGYDFIGDNTTITNMIEEVTGKQYTTYFVLEGDIVAGFIIVCINNQFGNTTPVIMNEYMYVKPEYRNGKATMYLYYMLGLICEDYGYDGVGTTFTTSSNTRNNQILGGEVIAQVTKFPLETINKVVNKYKKRIER
jgi:hypothetical protein